MVRYVHFSSCWMEELQMTVNGVDLTINWVYKIPCVATVIANFIFLVLIIVVLVCKLNNDSHRGASSPLAGNYDRATMIKTAKAVGKMFQHHLSIFLFKNHSHKCSSR